MRPQHYHQRNSVLLPLHFHLMPSSSHHLLPPILDLLQPVHQSVHRSTSALGSHPDSPPFEGYVSPRGKGDTGTSARDEGRASSMQQKESGLIHRYIIIAPVQFNDYGIDAVEDHS